MGRTDKHRKRKRNNKDILKVGIFVVQETENVVFIEGNGVRFQNHQVSGLKLE
jgi:hypothetical protein